MNKSFIIFFLFALLCILLSKQIVEKIGPVQNAVSITPNYNNNDTIPLNGFDSFPNRTLGDSCYISWEPPLIGQPTSYIVEAIVPSGIVSKSLTTYSNCAAFYDFNWNVSDKMKFSIRAINSNSISKAVITTNRDDACFPSGSLVSILLEDKIIEIPIELIIVGDFVIGAFGEVNQVIGLQQVFVGTNKLVKLNGNHITTDHHPHVTPTNTFLVCGNIPSGLYKHEHIIFDGHENVLRSLDGLDSKRIFEMKIGDKLKTLDGDCIVEKIEDITLDENDTLYNLVVSGSHTYCVDKYAVTGWPSEKDFDYTLWKTI